MLSGAQAGVCVASVAELRLQMPSLLDFFWGGEITLKRLKILSKLHPTPTTTTSNNIICQLKGIFTHLLHPFTALSLSQTPTPFLIRVTVFECHTFPRPVGTLLRSRTPTYIQKRKTSKSSGKKTRASSSATLRPNISSQGAQGDTLRFSQHTDRSSLQAQQPRSERLVLVCSAATWKW